MTERDKTDHVHDIVIAMSECGCMYQYLEHENIDQLELLRKFSVIGWVLLGEVSHHVKYLAVASKVAELKNHLQALYTLHSVNRARLCTTSWYTTSSNI